MIEEDDYAGRTLEAAAWVAEAHDREALSFTGARIGPYRIGERKKGESGKRWIYPAVHGRSGTTKWLTSNDVVRLARQARLDGLLVLMTPPWRDEDGAA